MFAGEVQDYWIYLGDDFRDSRSCVSLRSILEEFPIFSRVYASVSSPEEYEKIGIFSGRRLLNFFLYSAHLGSTVDTCMASVHEAMWKSSQVFSMKVDLGSDGRQGPDDLRRGLFTAGYVAFFGPPSSRTLRPRWRGTPGVRLPGVLPPIRCTHASVWINTHS